MAERQRISRELHDSTSQMLVALQLMIGEVRNGMAAGATHKLLDEMTKIIQHIHGSIKQIETQHVECDDALERRLIRSAKMFYAMSRTDRLCQ